MTDIYTLKALETFQCAGSNCPRTCCSGWQIEVEPALIDKWQHISDSEERDWLLSALPAKNDDNSQPLMKPEDLNCPFLSTDKLCKIQMQHDQTFIPTTCREYPRVNIKTKNRQYNSASLSCPEIVRMVLFDKKIDNPYQITQSGETSSSEQQAISHETINLALDKLINKVMKLDKFPLGLRLFYISSFFSDFFEHVKQTEIHPSQIDQVGKQLKENLYAANLAVKQNQIAVDPVTAGSYWKSIYSLCITQNIDSRFREDETLPLTQAILNNEDSHEGYANIYNTLQDYIKHCRPVIKKQYQQLLKTYTQVYFKNNGFPLLPRNKTTNITIVQCMLGLSILQLLLWMQVKQKNKLDESFLQELIVEVERQHAHHDSIAQHLEENNHMLQIGQYCTCFIDLF